MVVCAHIPVAPYAVQQVGRDVPLTAIMPLFASYSLISQATLMATLHRYSNLVLWIAGHVHRNTITPQPSGDPEHPDFGFWEVETPSLRDFPQQFRRFDIARTSDNNLSIFALGVDPAVNPVPAAGGTTSPAYTSRKYAIATQQIFRNVVGQGPNLDAQSGVYNAELVIPIAQLSAKLQERIAGLVPQVNAFSISRNAASVTGRVVTLNHTVAGSSPTAYVATESPDFADAEWQVYSRGPAFTLSSTPGVKTVRFKVRDGSGAESAVAQDSVILRLTPVVSSFGINGNATSTTSPVVTLNNTAIGSVPTQYMASASASFSGAAWQAYSQTPSFVLSSTTGTKTVYFKVRDGSGKVSAVARDSIALRRAGG
jgi:hypothetical protein